MFERFTNEARDTVTQAQANARELGHRRIGTEHLLLGLLQQHHGLARRLLATHGVDHATATAAVVRLTGPGSPDDGLDAAALESIGIDLDVVRQKVEDAFGPGALDGPADTPRRGGHIPFSPRAKKTLELSLREALRLKHRSIGDGHLLLGILREGEGLAGKIIADAGIDAADLRTEVERALGRATG